MTATASALDGAGLLDSLEDLSYSLRDGDWLASGLAGASLAIDTIAAALDPLGSLVGAGLGWLMEHLDPLKGWLTDLTGDAAEVASVAATWHGVGGHLDDAADDLTRMVRRDLELMSGAAIDAYVRYTDDLATHLRGLGDASSAVGAALAVCSTVVQVVHDLVRDTLSQLVGSIISWATEATLSLGLASPWIVSQVTSRVSSLAVRVGRSVSDVVSSAKALKGLVHAVDDVLSRVTRRLRSAGPVAAPAPLAPRRLDGSVASGGTPPLRPPDPAAKPTGRVTPIGPKEEAAKVLALTRENESAQTLARHGYDIEQNPHVPGLKKPDFRISGRIFDNYAPTSGRIRNIADMIEEKILEAQTSRVVLNLDDTAVAVADIEQQLLNWPIAGLEEVIVIKNGAVFQVLP